MEPDDEDADVKGAFVAIYAAGHDRAFGAGVLVADDVIVTCAHVVNAALGLDERAHLGPGTQPAGRIRVAFPYWGDETYAAVVVHHVPRVDSVSNAPLRFGADMWSGDIAVLRITDPPPSARPARFGSACLGDDVVAWYASGDARTVIEARVQTWAGPWIAVNAGWNGAAFAPGFSGGPLWDRRRGVVVGIVVSAAGASGYAIAHHELEGELTGIVSLRREAHLDPPQNPHVLEPFRAALFAAAALLPDRGPIAASVLSELHLPAPPEVSDWEDLIRRVVKVRRGLATVAAQVAELVGDTGIRRRLARAAADVSPGELLSSGEYCRLNDLLTGVAPERLATVALRALPLQHGLPAPSEGLHRLLDFLERRRFVEGRVPPLLRVAEFAAVTLKDPHHRDGLRAWSDRVASRLGVSEESLAEHRAAAEEWAEHRGRVRVQVALENTGDGRYRHQVWLHDGGEAQTLCTDDVPKNAADVIACLDEILWNWAEGTGGPVLVEFFVGLDDLELPVDQWIAPGLIDRIFGVEYEVVLRCLEPRARYVDNWHRRWRQMGTAEALVLDPDQAAGVPLYHFLNDSHRDVACVIVAADRAARREVLTHCLCAGFPAIIWSRDEAESATAFGLTARDLHSLLPEQLRRLRSEAAAGRRPGGKHLALIWDDPGFVPVRLQLSPPSRPPAAPERTP